MKKLLLALLFPTVVFAGVLQDSDRQELVAKNLLKNGGFENGKGSGGHKWTASGGTFNIVSSGSNLLTGKASATWDSSAASQTLLYSQISYPHHYDSGNGIAFCKIQTPSGTATHLLQVLDGSSNVLGSQTINSQATPIYTYVNFIYPASGGSVALQVKSVASDEPLIAIDDCFLGDMSEAVVGQISQAQFIGMAHFAGTASCTWTRTNTALGAFSTVAACPGPTVDLNPGPGVIQTTDADLPQVTVNNLPPGYYEVKFYGGLPSYATTQTACFAVSDGTTTAGNTCQTGASAGQTSMMATQAFFNYTSAGNRTFSLYSSVSTGTISLINTNTNPTTLYFTITRYPTTYEQAYRPDAAGPLLWMGAHDSTCSWARTNTSYGDPTADASCALVEKTNINFGAVSASGSTLPAISFTTKRQGRYLVIANLAGVRCGTTSATYAAQLIDAGSNVIANTTADCISGGTGGSPITLSGIYVAPSVGFAETLKVQTKESAGAITLNAAGTDDAVRWTIVSLDQQLPAPTLVNSVVAGSSGITKIGAVTVTAGCTTAATNDSGMFASGVSNSTGNCTLTWATGYFSATPTCTCTAAIANTNRTCMIDKTTPPTSTTLRTATYAAASATAEADDIHIVCVGKP